MMTLTVIGTGSSGNCYLLQHEDEILVLDAGLRFRHIIQKIPDFSKVVGVLITHEHMDHIAAADDFMIKGVPVYMTKGTAEAVWSPEKLRLKGLRLAVRGVPFRVGGFTVLSFETQHDAAEPCGYMIRCDATGEKLVYATDTYYLKYTFPGIHYWLIECTYVDEVMMDQLHDGAISLELRQRLKKSHMSLSRLKEAFQANDLTEARQIILCHLSDQRSDEQRMVMEIEEQTWVPTVAADAGMVIHLDTCPF